MKAETSDSDSAVSGENTAVATPETASQLGEDEYDREGSEGGDGETRSGKAHTAASSSATVVDSTTDRASVKGKGKALSVAAPLPPMPTGSAKVALEKKGGRNLVGRINNLVSSDLNSLENITMNFVYSSEYCRSRLWAPVKGYANCGVQPSRHHFRSLCASSSCTRSWDGGEDDTFSTPLRSPLILRRF